jgi:hypothetical protein
MAIAAAVGLVPVFAVAQDEPPSRFDVGVRGVLALSKGQPANDMVGEGLIARWRLRDQWHLGASYDNATFDYETPNRELGIASTGVVDGLNEWSRTSVFVERRYQTPRSWDWFWRAGVGFASLNRIDNVAGTRVGGGTFEIVTLADDEVHVFAGGGLRRRLGGNWAFDATFTIEHHSTDYQLTDVVSGARGTIGAQMPYGLALGVSYAFGRDSRSRCTTVRRSGRG